jgi:hypothetical protein
MCLSKWYFVVGRLCGLRSRLTASELGRLRLSFRCLACLTATATAASSPEHLHRLTNNAELRAFLPVRFPSIVFQPTFDQYR